METFQLNKEVENQINTKELIHLINYFSDNIYFDGFDCLNILSMSSNDEDLMVKQIYKLNIFFAPRKNVKVTFEVYRAKNWSCSNTSHKVIDVIEA
jgi:hypothetical protein